MRSRIAHKTVAALCISLAACNDSRITGGERFDEFQTPQIALEKNIGGDCSGDTFPSNLPGPLSCCQDGNRTFHTTSNASGAGTVLALRGQGTACTEADGVSTNCGVGTAGPCFNGPCGAHIEWAVIAEEAHVFYPESKPAMCGYEVKNVIEVRSGVDWAVGSSHAKPEAFADQQEHSGATATCPYRRCVAGVPTL
jgi:hypothetical protein